MRHIPACTVTGDGDNGRIEISDMESRVIDQPAAICKQQIFSHDAAHIDSLSFD